ncbi:MAG: Mur ligase family protein, partial [Patescibacteria group bacterium]
MIQKSILQKILAVLARQTIRKYKPVIIGITGSVGKTSARLATYAVLKNKFSVRTAEKNYNNEIGLPLTILGIPHSGRNIFAWAYQLAIAARRLAVSLAYRRYPEVLILEYGVDCPGDMGYLLKIARPDIAVTTAIGEVPVHVEFFKSPEELIAETAKLVAG